MVDWGLVARIEGGFGVTILVLVILSLVTWVMGLVVQRYKKAIPDGKKNPGKGI
ncbi:OadG family protein [Chloroflexota bacterium]